MLDIFGCHSSFTRLAWPMRPQHSVRKTYKFCFESLETDCLCRKRRWFPALPTTHTLVRTSLHLPQEKLCNFEKPIPPCHILTGTPAKVAQSSLQNCSTQFVYRTALFTKHFTVGVSRLFSKCWHALAAPCSAAPTFCSFR